MLTNLYGLGALASIGGYLQLWNNAGLSTLEGAGALTSIAGPVNISFNIGLPTCEVCDLLENLVGFTAGAVAVDNLGDSCTGEIAPVCP
jgi:hypothetical protein